MIAITSYRHNSNSYIVLHDHASGDNQLSGKFICTEMNPRHEKEPPCTFSCLAIQGQKTTTKRNLQNDYFSPFGYMYLLFRGRPSEGTDKLALNYLPE